MLTFATTSHKFLFCFLFITRLKLCVGLSVQDRALCAHVLSVHYTGHAPERTDAVELLDAATLRSYIAKAKQFNPHIPEELTGTMQTGIDYTHGSCKAMMML